MTLRGQFVRLCRRQLNCRVRSALVAAACGLATVSCGGGGGADLAWGQAKMVFAGSASTATVEVQGNDFGLDRVRVPMFGNGDVQGLVLALNAEVAARQSRVAGTAFGIVPQRVPSVEYREGRSSDPGYAVVDIDPVTGAPRLQELRYNDDLTPYNADATIDEQRRNVVSRMFESALEREAVALDWEVQTARLQQNRGDARAGLSEVLRAAASGRLAPFVGGSTSLREPGRFMPLALDLDGDGAIATVPDSASRRAIDWDGRGYLKQVGWVGAGDGLLFLDRDGDGQVGQARELFSNPLLVDAAKGVASLEWFDSGGDGSITSADPVFPALRVWRDADANGLIDAGEAIALADLGITQLEIRTAHFVREGVAGLLVSTGLAAALSGYRITSTPNGPRVECSDGSASTFFGVSSETQLELERLCR